MNNKKFLFGSLFVVLSAVIYEIEKIFSYFKWTVNIYLFVNGGSSGYESHPEMVSLSSNYYIILFLLIGICFYIAACLPLFKKNNFQ